MCKIHLAEGGEPVACGLGWTVRFATLIGGGRTRGDGFSSSMPSGAADPPLVCGIIALMSHDKPKSREFDL